MKFAGWYGFIVGMLMLAQWGFFLAAGQVPELRMEPLRISFHLAGELITALGLAASGIMLLRGKARAAPAYLVFAGMGIYSEIVSPGYFAQLGQWAFVAMFAVLLILAAASVFALTRDM